MLLFRAGGFLCVKSYKDLAEHTESRIRKLEWKMRVDEEERELLRRDDSGWLSSDLIFSGLFMFFPFSRKPS